MTPTRLADRYVLDELIAAGGMGEVHRARDERLGRQVAVKVLARGLTDSPESIERFRREALASAGLAHPNIARVYDYDVEDGRHFIVMEYVAGPSLERLIRDRGRLSPTDAAAITMQVCAALAAAHRAGIVHRDIKPGNVLICPDGTVKVTDFGIAKALGAATLTDAGTVLGTAAYLPPEVGRGGSAGPASDLYSLGIVLYQMLTGQVPFTGETPVAVAMRHIAEDVPPPSTLVPGLPPILDAVVARSTMTLPQDRYPSAEAMADALRYGNTRTAPDTTEAMTQPMPLVPVEPLPTVAMGPKATTPPTAALEPTAAMPSLEPTAAMVAATPTVEPVPTLAMAQRVPTHPLQVARPEAQPETQPEVAPPAPRRGGPGRNRLAWGLSGLVLALAIALGAWLIGGDQSPRSSTPPAATPQTSSTSPTTQATPTGKTGVVPDGLVGTDLDSAIPVIRAAHLKYKWVMVASNAPRNQVLEVSPPPGTTLQAGDTVHLTISRGKPGDAATDTGNNGNGQDNNGKGNDNHGNGN